MQPQPLMQLESIEITEFIVLQYIFNNMYVYFVFYASSMVWALVSDNFFGMNNVYVYVFNYQHNKCRICLKCSQCVFPSFCKLLTVIKTVLSSTDLNKLWYTEIADSDMEIIL